MYTQITKSALSTGDEHIPEWTEKSKQKLAEVLQYIKDNYRQPTYEEEQRQKEWNEYWLRGWSNKEYSRQRRA